MVYLGLVSMRLEDDLGLPAFFPGIFVDFDVLTVLPVCKAPALVF
jgi:hypothetical protein